MYDDSTCFSNGVVDHTVVVVGYNLLASVPYFVIKNSWGTSWGDSGYMQLSVTGGDGTCGINTTPALYPVVKGEAREKSSYSASVTRCRHQDALRMDDPCYAASSPALNVWLLVSLNLVFFLFFFILDDTPTFILI